MITSGLFSPGSGAGIRSYRAGSPRENGRGSGDHELTEARYLLSGVVDPEIPVLTIGDLGILRSVEWEDARLVATITPTYSGCPALRQIEDEIRRVAGEAGLEVEVRVSQSPAWTTDWMTPEARAALERFGIAPPSPPDRVLCPRCRAPGARVVSWFGSTACKALLACAACGEPFDHFKEH